MPRNESLRSSAALLGIAGGIEFLLQMAIPILLARVLDEVAFAQYRLLWLLAGTALAIAPMFMPQSLFYFLSRAGAHERRACAGNVLIFLAAAGLLSGLALSSLNPWLPDAALGLSRDSANLSAWFLALWVVASALDALPTADGRAAWQAGAIIALALLRTALLAAAALLSGDILWIAGTMLAVAAIKLLLAVFYMQRFIPGPNAWDGALMRRQLVYAVPFAIGHALFLLRVQADQWVVVSTLPAAMFAAYSVAAVVLPVSTLIRQPVNNAMLPRLNRMMADGENTQAARLIALSNSASGMVLIPVAGGLFVCAPELVELIYTDRYSEAAPVMQVYLVGMVITALAVGHTLSALGRGRFSVINSGCCLLLSVVLCILLIDRFGMQGAAAGSMLALAAFEAWNLVAVARTLRTSPMALINWRVLLPAVWATAGALLIVQSLSVGDMPLWQALLSKGALYALVFLPLFLLVGGRQAALVLSGIRARQPVIEGGAT